jgi:hypothetical protein
MGREDPVGKGLRVDWPGPEVTGLEVATSRAARNGRSRGGDGARGAVSQQLPRVTSVSDP